MKISSEPPAKVLFSGWPRFGSVRLRFGGGTVRAVPVFERFRRFLCKSFFSLYFCTVQEARTVPVSVPGNGSGGSGSAFGFGKTVPTVLVSGSGSVPEPLCYLVGNSEGQDRVFKRD